MSSASTGGGPTLFAISALLLILSAPLSGDAYQVPADAHFPAYADSSTHFEVFPGYEVPADAFPLSLVFVGEPVDGLTHRDMARAIEDAAAAWNDVPCSFAYFQWAGFRDSTEDVADGEVRIYFGDMAPVFIAGTPMVSNPPQDSSVKLNQTSFSWSLRAEPFQDRTGVERPVVDITAVLAHEFGHLLGLFHTNEHNVATMFAKHLYDGSQKVLSADDKLGACHLFPVHESECSHGGDCPSGASCISGPQGSVCDIPMGDVGDYCGLELQYCPERCHIDDRQTGTGYCTVSCHSDNDCPEHFRCASDDSDTEFCRFAPSPRPPDDGCSTTGGPPAALLVIVLVGAGMLRRK